MGSGWPNSAWDCSAALPRWDPSPWAVLAIIPLNSPWQGQVLRGRAERAQRAAPSAAIFQCQVVSLGRELSFMAAILLPSPKQSLAHFSYSVLCLHTLASCGLTAESSQGDFQPLSVILRKGCSHPTNKLALEISLPHTSCSLDFTAFVLLFLVLFCLARKPAHIPTGLVLFKGLHILYVPGVTPSICCCYTKAMHC